MNFCYKQIFLLCSFAVISLHAEQLPTISGPIEVQLQDQVVHVYQSVHTDMFTEFDPSKSKLIRMWHGFNQNHQDLMDACDKTIALYTDYQDFFNYHVAIGFLGDVSSFPAFEQKMIPGGRYLLFQGTGACPFTTRFLWEYIMSYFASASNSSYQRAKIADYEVYFQDQPEYVEIYVSIK